VIDREEALRICDEHFPNGLDYLIGRLSVRVDRSDIGDVDGWCYYLPNGNRVVRLSSTSTKERQRFTLAHELAHFVIGMRQTLTLCRDVYDPKGPEEQKANDLASQLLLPTRPVAAILEGHAIDYLAIKELINKAKVSDIVVALRLAKSKNEFGLDRPTVIWFENGQIKAIHPRGRKVPAQVATVLFSEASSSADRTTRQTQPDGTVLVASVLPNANYPTLFLYHAKARESQASPRRSGLKAQEAILFANDEALRSILNGIIGGQKKRLLLLDISERTDFVIERFINAGTSRLPEHLEKVQSQECYEWIYAKMEALG